ncbi:MAG: DUF4238 domain-containing protein [Syntrophorhabdaceae bacterium]|nr:DUF4238 domain-containing protein [Syntrophorhabdaceae bacterium]
MNGPKRHHYLPQFYLEGFCRDGYLWVFDRETSEFRRQTPVNTAIQKHYYTVEDKDGKKDTSIEAFLSEIEGASKPVIQKIEAKEQISDDDKYAMSVFIAFLMHRVPDFEKSVNKIGEHMIKHMADVMFSDEERAELMMKRYAEDRGGDESEMSAKDLVAFHKSGAYKIDMHRNVSLRCMLNMSTDIANLFFQLDWILFHVPKKSSFVTSDSPVFIIPPVDWNANTVYGVGLATRGAQKVVPLTQEVCLVMCDRGERMLHGDLANDNVRRLNRSIAYYSDRFLIGRDEALVRNLTQTMKLAEWKRNGRIQIH